MRKRIAVAICSAALLALPTSAGAAPGQDIKAACGLSFGQLISGANSSGTAAHSSYAGGANAFSNPGDPRSPRLRRIALSGPEGPAPRAGPFPPLGDRGVQARQEGVPALLVHVLDQLALE